MTSTNQELMPLPDGFDFDASIATREPEPDAAVPLPDGFDFDASIATQEPDQTPGPSPQSQDFYSRLSGASSDVQDIGGRETQKPIEGSYAQPPPDIGEAPAPTDMTITLDEVQQRDKPHQDRLARLKAMQPDSPETMLADYQALGDGKPYLSAGANALTAKPVAPGVEGPTVEAAEDRAQFGALDEANRQLKRSEQRAQHNALAFLDTAVPMPENWRAALSGMTPDERRQLLSAGAPESVGEKIVSGLFSGAGMGLGLILPGGAARKIVGATGLVRSAPVTARAAESGLGFLFYGQANLPTDASLGERAKSGAWDGIIGSAFGLNSVLAQTGLAGKIASLPVAMGLGAATAGKGALPEDRWVAATTLGLLHGVGMVGGGGRDADAKARRMMVDEIRREYGDKYGAIVEKTLTRIPDVEMLRAKIEQRPLAGGPKTSLPDRQAEARRDMTARASKDIAAKIDLPPEAEQRVVRTLAEVKDRDEWRRVAAELVNTEVKPKTMGERKKAMKSFEELHDAWHGSREGGPLSVAEYEANRASELRRESLLNPSDKALRTRLYEYEKVVNNREKAEVDRLLAEEAANLRAVEKDTTGGRDEAKAGVGGEVQATERVAGKQGGEGPGGVGGDNRTPEVRQGEVPVAGRGGQSPSPQRTEPAAPLRDVESKPPDSPHAIGSVVRRRGVSPKNNTWEITEVEALRPEELPDEQILHVRQVDAKGKPVTDVEGNFVEDVITVGDVAKPTGATSRSAPAKSAQRETAASRLTPEERAQLDDVPKGQREAVAQRMLERRGGDQNLSEQAKDKRKGGWVTLSAGKFAENPIIRKLRQLLTFNRGTNEQVLNDFNRRSAEAEYGQILGSNHKRDYNDYANTLAQKMSRGTTTGAKAIRDGIHKDFADMSEGVITSADFVRKYGGRPEAQKLADLNDSAWANVRARSNEIADRLAAQGQFDLAEQVRNNTQYQTRMYAKHVLGVEFEPNPANVRAATASAAMQIAEAVDNIIGGANAIKKKTGMDVLRYMETRDAALLAGLTQEQKVRIYNLAVRWREFEGIMQPLQYDPRTGLIDASFKGAAEVEAQARMIVEHALRPDDVASPVSGTSGPTSTVNFKRRILEQVWRDLYGEIKDPVERMRRTIEVQTGILASMRFWDKMVASNEGTLWSRTRSEKFTERIGTENPADKEGRRKYGDMNGTYATKEFKDFVVGEGRSELGPLAAGWKAYLDYTRMSHLVGVPTIARNYLSNIFQFALQNGDTSKPGFWSALREGNAIAARFAAGRDTPADRALMAKLADLDVYRAGSESTTSDIAAQAASPFAGQSVARAHAGAMKWVGDRYALLDFPAKYAAFKANTRALGSEQAAAEWVRRFYQYRGYNLKLAGAISKTGLRDFDGYKIDATRIMLNALQYAKDEAARGNFRPAVHFAAARALQGLLASTAADQIGEFAGKLWVYLKEKATGDKASVERMEIDETQAMREFLDDWQASNQIITWREKSKDGTTTVNIADLTPWNAFPLEATIEGVLQASWGTNASIADAAKKSLSTGSLVGMGPQSIMRLFAGREFGSTYKTTGLLELSDLAPEKRMDAAKEAGRRFLAQTSIPGFRHAERATALAAKGPRLPGEYRRTTSMADVANTAFNPVRITTYRKDDIRTIAKNKLAIRLRDDAKTLGAVNKMKALQVQDSITGQTRATPDVVSKGEFSRALYVKRAAQMQGLVNNLKVFGRDILDPEDVVEVLASSGMSRQAAVQYYEGRGVEYATSILLERAPNPGAIFSDGELKARAEGRTE